MSASNGAHSITAFQFLSWLYDCMEFRPEGGADDADWEFKQEFGFDPGWPDMDLSETDLVVTLGANRFRITVEKLQ